MTKPQITVPSKVMELNHYVEKTGTSKTDVSLLTWGCAVEQRLALLEAEEREQPQANVNESLLRNHQHN